MSFNIIIFLSLLMSFDAFAADCRKISVTPPNINELFSAEGREVQSADLLLDCKAFVFVEGVFQNGILQKSHEQLCLSVSTLENQTQIFSLQFFELDGVEPSAVQYSWWHHQSPSEGDKFSLTSSHLKYVDVQLPNENFGRTRTLEVQSGRLDSKKVQITLSERIKRGSLGKAVFHCDRLN